MKIKQDIHIHTYHSACAIKEATPQFYMDNAKEIGLELTDDHVLLL